jgi:glycosyltransferase involved in cell wall biosynthesis
MTAPRTPAHNITVLDVNWESSFLLWSELAGRAPLHFLKTTTFNQGGAAGLTLRECRRLQQPMPGITLRQLLFPPGWFSHLSFVCLPWLAWRIRRDLTACGRTPDILVISYPQYALVARWLRPRKLVYYCVDDYRQYRPERARTVEQQENQVVANADLVVCSSRFMQAELARRVPLAHSRIVHVPNGTRSSFLVKEPLAQPDPLPPDLAHLQRPILGYLGGITGRINWDLMDELVRAFPHATILMIGPAPRKNSADDDRLRRFQRAANFYYAGPRPQERIMDYIRAFDVCLIPEPYTPFGLATCQQKVWNYLASSRPIVSTNIPEQAALTPAVRIAETPADFSAHVQRLLDCQGNDGLAERRLVIAREYTWPRLADRVWSVLSPLLDSQPSPSPNQEATGRLAGQFGSSLNYEPNELA